MKVLPCFRRKQFQLFVTQKLAKKLKIQFSKFQNIPFWTPRCWGLSWKTNVLNLWKWQCLVFCKFLSDEVETVFWENGAKPLRPFKFKFGHSKPFRNGFEATFRSKMIVLSVWKGHFSFFANFLLTKLKRFSRKVRQSTPNYLDQNLVIISF